MYRMIVMVGCRRNGKGVNAKTSDFGDEKIPSRKKCTGERVGAIFCAKKMVSQLGYQGGDARSVNQILAGDRNSDDFLVRRMENQCLYESSFERKHVHHNPNKEV